MNDADEPLGTCLYSATSTDRGNGLTARTRDDVTCQPGPDVPHSSMPLRSRLDREMHRTPPTRQMFERRRPVLHDAKTPGHAMGDHVPTLEALLHR